MDQTEILECGHPPTPEGERHSITTGYGTDKDGKRFCFACCAERDRESMKQTGRAVLYFVLAKNDNPANPRADWEVSNWPGSLRFQPFAVTISRGRGFGGEYPRANFRFNGPDGYVWSGMHQGHNNQIAHCKRTKTEIPEYAVESQHAEGWEEVHRATTREEARTILKNYETNEPSISHRIRTVRNPIRELTRPRIIKD